MKLNNSILIIIVGYEIKDTKYLESLNKYLIYDPKLKDYTIEIAIVLGTKNDLDKLDNIFQNIKYKIYDENKQLKNYNQTNM